MSLKTGAGLVVTACAVLAASDAFAGILSKVSHELASGATAGAVEKLEPALARTIADADSRLTNQETHIGNIMGGLISQTSDAAGARLNQVDGILEKRILQVQLGVDQVLDNGLDKIDGVARLRIVQIGDVLGKRIKQVDSDLASRLNQADNILKSRIADLGQAANSAVDRADQALDARIRQLDEVAGRRLGNVDVIASKQRLGLESTITRLAWLIALIVFVVVLIRALWLEYLKRESTIAGAAPGTARAWRYLTVLGKPLLRHALVGGAVAVVLAVVPARLPMAATRDQQALTQQHYADLQRAVEHLDWTRARFHASQLEFLEPDNANHYQALAAKADLLRDVLSRPTAIATPAGVKTILDEVRALERLQGGRPDPDAQTVRAMIEWQQGGTRAQEHQAATLAARALWATPRGFTLAPMARLLVQAYRHAPVAAPDDDPRLDSLGGFDAALKVPVALPDGSPFEGATALFELMQRLDDDSSAAYLAMIQAQVIVHQPSADAVTRSRARENRAKAAGAVVKAWEDFDKALAASPLLANNPLVLSVFRLNDVMLTHALWFTTDPNNDAWPKRLSALTGEQSKAKKLALAPARAVWARRYAALLQGPARELIELQEADRFQSMETNTLAFEEAMAALGGDAAPDQDGPETKHDRSRKKAKALAQAQEREEGSESLDARKLAAANAAAALGLYQQAPGSAARTPVAVALLGDLVVLEKKLNDAGSQTKAAVGKAGAGGKAKVDTAGDDLQEGLRALRVRLLARGPRLI
jgi:hypothetical protein